MDSAQHCVAVILNIGGAARALTRSMSFAEMTEGGIANGQPDDAVTYLIANLATHLGPLGDGSRLSATLDLV
eukprot:1895655-Pyramimonas_sp.AAC.1